MATEALVVDAFAQLGLEAQLFNGAHRSAADLVLDLDGSLVTLEIKYRSLVTDDVAKQLLAEPPSADGAGLVVVGDRVTEAARTVSTSARGGYLDLRGRLAIRAAGLVIDTDVAPVKARAERSTALSGKAGLEIATAFLMRPERPVVVRELARDLGRSPSTTSEVLAALRRDGVIDVTNAVSSTDLFWRVADRWPAQRVLLATLPADDDASLARPLRLGLDDVDHEQGWALSDSAAATTLLGTAASGSQARATVRVAPVPAVVAQRVRSESAPWPLAHPLFVALDLTQDVGRGREILDAWTPDRWARVW